MPDTAAGRHLVAWLEAHNDGGAPAIRSWMRSKFSPERLSKMDLSAHEAFYQEAASRFGEIRLRPDRILESEENRLVVQILNVGVEDVASANPDHVLIVEAASLLRARHR